MEEKEEKELRTPETPESTVAPGSPVSGSPRVKPEEAPPPVPPRRHSERSASQKSSLDKSDEAAAEAKEASPEPAASDVGAERVRAGEKEAKGLRAERRKKIEEIEKQRNDAMILERTQADEKFTALAAKLAAGKRTADEILVRLRQRAKKEAVYGKSAMTPWREPPGASEAPDSSFKQAWLQVYQLPIKLGEQHVVRSEYLNIDITKRVKAIGDDMEKCEKKCLSDMHAHSRAVDSANEVVGKAHVAYQQAVVEADAAVASNRPIKVDPWVLEVKYRSAVAALAASRANHHRACVDAIRTTARLEAARIDLLRNVFNDFLNQEKRSLLLEIKAVDDVLESVGMVSTLADVRTFVVQLDQSPGPQSPPMPELQAALPGAPPSPQQPTPSAALQAQAQASAPSAGASPVATPREATAEAVDVPDPFSSPEVEKHGPFRRHGMLMWKDSYCVLTKNGFLHIFNHEKDAEPQESIPLIQSSVALTDKAADEFTFEVTALEKNEGMFSRNRSFKILLKARNEEMMVDWVAAIRKKSRTNKPAEVKK